MDNLFQDVTVAMGDMSDSMDSFFVKNGVYLDAIELNNWGSFKLTEITLNSFPSLFVGENGTGKTTIVDALMTLLTKNPKYNSSSDAKGKDKLDRRSLAEYVRGFKESTRENGHKSVQYLRSDGEISIILLRFRSGVDYYSIANVFRVDDNKDPKKDPQRFYVFSEGYMSIRNNFLTVQGDTFESYRSAIGKQNNIVVTSDRKKYFDFVRLKIGLIDDNAMKLLQMLVSKKEVKDMNVLIRKHMFLNRTDFSSDYEQTNAGIDVVLTVEKELREDRLRNSMLETLVPCINDGLGKTRQYNLLSNLRNKVRPYVFRNGKAVANKELSNLENRLKDVDRSLASLNRSRDDVKDTIHSLEHEKGEKGGFAVTQKEAELTRLQEKQQRISDLKEHYEQVLSMLDIPMELTSEVTFQNTQNNVEEYRKNLDDEYDKKYELYQKANEQHLKAVSTYQKYQNESWQLEKNKIAIDEKLVFVRDTICKDLKVDPSTMPFLGEYLSVNDKEWIPALESVMRRKSISFLVEESMAEKVSDYLDAHVFKGIRFEYIVMHPVKQPVLHEKGTPAWKKIQVLATMPYAGWVKNYIRYAANYYCCDTPQEFNRLYPAITKSGQVRYDNYSRIKDDRFNIHDAKRYVMSGSYKERLQALDKAILEASNEKKRCSTELVSAKSALDDVKRRQQVVNEIPKVKSFEEIDIKTVDAEIAECKEALKVLKNNKDLINCEKNIQNAKDKLKGIENKTETVKTERDAVNIEISALAGKIKEYEEESVDVVFNDEEEAIMKEMYDKYAPSSKKPVFDTIMKTSTTILKQISGQASKIEKEKNAVCEEAVKKMNQYVNHFVSAKNNLKPTMTEEEEAKRFIEEYERIRDDILPKAQEKLEQIWNTTVMHQISTFVASLTYHIDDDIANIVDNINDILRRVPYSQSPTFVQIGCQHTKDGRIVELRKKLNNLSMSNGLMATATDKEKEEAIALYSDLKEYIDKYRIKTNGTYHEDNILDPRNWFEFPAAQYKKVTDEDGQEELVMVKVLDNVAKQSGGEGVKLTYFILAACFGMCMHLLDENYSGKTFRFLLIDEIGDKLSPTNLRDVIHLFRELKIQLVSLMPLDDKVSRYEGFVGNIVRTDFINSLYTYAETLTYSEYVKRNKQCIEEKLRKARE